MRVEGSRIELAKNRLILSHIYSTLLPLPPLQSKRAIILSNPKYQGKPKKFFNENGEKIITFIILFYFLYFE